jgi:diguanylate cyclase (GGDEF)-like protein
VLAFGRQVYLLIDNQRAVVTERALREEAMRRNKQLEALTGLATTMTQTLEEPPIIEQALHVLHLAARATSAALLAHTDDGLQVRATTGDWHAEHAWADSPPKEQGARSVQKRGGRQIIRVRLAARKNEIGFVTLMRPASDPIEDEELDLLGLLVDELAVAIQNARDYREKLEQAIRDPLTGLYNRRFFFEALEKEVLRSERYGSDVAIVIFDVDNFKLINDTMGHSTGDEVLRRIGEIVERLIRPIDSFARIGGEEFALLLPETRQLDALLVAERIRVAISRHSVLPGRRVTISGGIAACPQDASSREELHRRADAALYWSKRNGKDMCAVPNEVALAEISEDGSAALSHLYGLVNVIDAQHLHTRDHSENVAAYAVALGQALGFTPERIVRLRRAAFLHDVGKVAVNRDLLDKPDKLTDDEYEQMKLHPTVGGMMLSHAGLYEEAHWVRSHHERVDGQGYPAGLSADEIPLEARILFVADAFEAMTSDRPYHAGVGVNEALAELRRCAGTQFDARVVGAFANLVERGDVAVLALRNEGNVAAP